MAHLFFNVDKVGILKALINSKYATEHEGRRGVPLMLRPTRGNIIFLSRSLSLD